MENDEAFKEKKYPRNDATILQPKTGPENAPALSSRPATAGEDAAKRATKSRPTVLYTLGDH